MTRSLLVLASAMLVAIAVRADDGILYYYGSPRLMHGESRIRMVSEVVKAKVYRDHADVYCRFVFHNDGAGTLARIGFPDGAGPSEEGEPPRHFLKNFRSRVDGKFVKLRIEPNKTTYVDAEVFHVKTVRFKEGQTRIVEDWYRANLSGGATSSMVSSPKGGQEDLNVSQFTYIMASGGSWHGNIGDATVQVDFMEKKFRKIYSISEETSGAPFESTKFASFPPNAVVWAGFASPVASANRMVFRRHNFKPTKKDDVCLTFDALRFDDSIWGGKG